MLSLKELNLTVLILVLKKVQKTSFGIIQKEPDSKNSNLQPPFPQQSQQLR